MTSTARLEAIPDEAIAEMRRQLPVVDECIYMDHAFLGPVPASVVDRVTAACRAASARTGACWPERKQVFEHVRSACARFVGAASPNQLAFVANTTEAISIVAAGYRFREGDNVVAPAGEFPANDYPWLQVTARGVEYRRVAPRAGRVTATDLIARADERTRVIAVSWVQPLTGYRLELRELSAFCRERDILLALDAAQGLGVLDLDVERDGVDVCAAPSYKWLLGPEGLGLLYVSERALSRIDPPRLGIRSLQRKSPIERLADLQYADGALRFEAGTLNAPGIYGLGAALELFDRLGGIRAVERRVVALTERLERGLARLHMQTCAPECDTPIVVARRGDRDASELTRALREQRVVAAERRGWIRFSPHVYNTAAEVDAVLERLARILESPPEHAP